MSSLAKSFRQAIAILATSLLITTLSGCSLLAPNSAPAPQNTAGDSSPPDAPDDLVFSKLTDDFTFASGVGGWSTNVSIAPDGSFKGTFTDSEMGDTGPGYPNGTVLFCHFQGQFDMVEQVNEFEYLLVLAQISQEGNPGDEEIDDGILYKVSTPYGFDNADKFSLYTPGHPVDTLPEPFLEWMRMPQWLPDDAETLPFWGLYNINSEEGFYSGQSPL